MKVLVANRGEIACRILRTLREMELRSVAVFTQVDQDSPHVRLADEAVALGTPDRYLDAPAILGAARSSGATAIHPGYGFLSQSAEFAIRCAGAGLTFIGPSPEAMKALGDKRGSRATAERLGIPVVRGAQDADSLAAAGKAAEGIGYPVLLKAAGGGGGKGMRLVQHAGELQEALEAARREALAAFGDGRLLLEKYVFPARHVEVQILGDGKEAVALGERECSLQRRYQKVIEESPAPVLPPSVRTGLLESAVKLAKAVGYRSAGTVEFLVDSAGGFTFLEVNTRLQVEHPVTEMLTGMDIVRAQIEIAQGRPLPAVPSARGHAIEARLTAEDPHRGFLPQTGVVRALRWPQIPGIRIDSGICEGWVVGPHYDSLLAKVIAWGADREQARRRLLSALRESVLEGVFTNRRFLIQLLESRPFTSAQTFTTTLESTTWPPLPDEPEMSPPSAPSSGPGNDRYSPWNGAPGGMKGVPAAGSRAAGTRTRAGSTREIRAPMTGRVLKTAVVEGAAVRANDVLIILEAMKMEYRLAAPRDGVIESVRCREGDQVELDRVLVTLKP